MRIGYFAPLPPAPTGVADYALALLTALRWVAVNKAAVNKAAVNKAAVNEGAVNKAAVNKAAVHEPGSVEVDAENYDLALYHVGNNQLHRDIYERALEKPGVTVLHDAVLQHLFLGWLDRDRYVEEFVYNYGEWSRGFAEELWTHRARSGADPRYFEFPMLKRIATRSRAIIVHNRAAECAVRRHAPDARVVEIPHLFVRPDLPDAVETLRFRQDLGLGPRTLLVGVFGYQRESKRLPVVLRALHRAWRAGADARLLVAGAFVSSDLDRALTPLLEDPRILRAGRLSERDFWRYAAAIDLCINLRFPTAGETSGIAIRMMGIGKPVAFTEGQEIARIPEDACLRIDLGPGEETMLTDYLIWLADDREAAIEIGQRAAQHIASEHDPEKVAEQYWRVLAEVAER